MLICWFRLLQNFGNSFYKLYLNDMSIGWLNILAIEYIFCVYVYLYPTKHIQQI